MKDLIPEAEDPMDVDSILARAKEKMQGVSDLAKDTSSRIQNIDLKPTDFSNEEEEASTPRDEKRDASVVAEVELNTFIRDLESVLREYDIPKFNTKLLADTKKMTDKKAKLDNIYYLLPSATRGDLDDFRQEISLWNTSDPETLKHDYFPKAKQRKDAPSVVAKQEAAKAAAEEAKAKKRADLEAQAKADKAIADGEREAAKKRKAADVLFNSIPNFEQYSHNVYKDNPGLLDHNAVWDNYDKKYNSLAASDDSRIKDWVAKNPKVQRNEKKAISAPRSVTVDSDNNPVEGMNVEDGEDEAPSTTFGFDKRKFLEDLALSFGEDVEGVTMTDEVMDELEAKVTEDFVDMLINDPESAPAPYDKVMKNKRMRKWLNDEVLSQQKPVKPSVTVKDSGGPVIRKAGEKKAKALPKVTQGSKQEEVEEEEPPKSYYVRRREILDKMKGFKLPDLPKKKEQEKKDSSKQEEVKKKYDEEDKGKEERGSTDQPKKKDTPNPSGEVNSYDF